MPERTAAPTHRAFAAVVLVILGVGLCVLWKAASGTERHSYDSGAVPPAYVAVTRGDSYSIAVPGGVHSEVDPAGLTCTITGAGIGTQALTITAEPDTTKATNQVASFIAPTTGQVHVACRGLGSVFVDDADDAGFDYAGLLLLLGVISLTIGLPLGLSVLRTAGRASTTRSSEASTSR